MIDEMVRVDRLVRTLRARCPWDAEQTHASLRRHLLEETYETLEALDAIAACTSASLSSFPSRSLSGSSAPQSPSSSQSSPPSPPSLSPSSPSPSSPSPAGAALDDSLCEELGDLLYQVWFHSLLASERGAFGVADVARRLHDKLVARHPHVFGEVEARDADAVRANWDVIKQAEKGRDSTLDGIPATLPALLRAVKVLKRAAAGELMEPADPASCMEEARGSLAELGRDPSEERLGDLLMAAVGLGRCLSIDPEDALRAATDRAERRYRRIEREARRASSAGC